MERLGNLHSIKQLRLGSIGCLVILANITPLRSGSTTTTTTTKKWKHREVRQLA